MFKLFNKKKTLKELKCEAHELIYLMDCVIEDCDDILEDIDGLQESNKEYMRILLIVQKQCDQLVKNYEAMQKRDTTENVLDRIDIIIEGYDNGNADE